jgi:hypothetical protein
MSRTRVWGCVALLLAATHARAACPPPDVLLQGVRSATRIQVEQLGSDASRVDTPLAHVPGRTLGYEVQGVFRVSGAVADALQRTFGRHDSYACGAEQPRATFHTPGALQIGFLFASQASAVAVVLHLPEGRVEVQLEGGVHTSAPLSRAGQRHWEEALAQLAHETHTSPDDFYEQMLPPATVPPAPRDSAIAPDSSRDTPRDSSHAPRDEPHTPR